MDGVDDFGVVDPTQIRGSDPDAGVPELMPPPAVHTDLATFAAFTQKSLTTPKHAGGRQADAARTGITVERLMTTREKLHLLVDELTDAEAAPALAPLAGERELLRQWTGPTEARAEQDEWALANAREAIREESW